MDILDPILTEPGDAASIVEVTPRTETCIKAGFQSMSNATRRCLRSKDILPKAPLPPLGQGLCQLLLKEHEAIGQGFGTYPGPHVRRCGTII